MEPPTCPESISEPPKSVFPSWPWAAGIIRFFSELCSKKSTSHRPSGISSKSNKLLQVILCLSAFSKKVRTRNCFLLDFVISGQQKCRTSENNKKTIFHFKPSGIHFTETLSDKYPMSRPIQGAYFRGFPTLENLAGRRRRKDAQIWPAPVPTCAGIKYPVRGNLSLWPVGRVFYWECA